MGLFSGILGAVGGILGLNSSKKAASQQQSNWQAQHQLAVDQFEFQKDYTKNRIQWQIEDAKKAGLHPMAAVGLSPTSFSPVSSSPGNPVQPLDYSWVGNLGQNLDYASAKGKTSFQQAKALQLTTEAAELQNDGLRLDNELKQMEIMSMLSRLTNSGPAAPSVGNPSKTAIEGQDDAVKIVPDEVIATGNSPSVTAGSHPLWTHGRSGDFAIPVLSDKLADSVTENKEKHLGAEISYAISAFNGGVRPPDNAFTPHEKYLLKTGEYKAYYWPMIGWRVEPRMSAENFRKFLFGGYRRGPSVSGRIVR